MSKRYTISNCNTEQLHPSLAGPPAGRLVGCRINGQQAGRLNSDCIFSSSRRGTAEIELILVCTILITLLLLSVGAMRIGAARLSAGGSAGFHAMHDATEAGTPEYATGTPLAVSQFPDTLPNRVHEPQESTQVTGPDGNKGAFTATVTSKASVIGPAWTFSAYPVGQADQDTTKAWFDAYVDESHNGLTDSLGLAESWTP